MWSGGAASMPRTEDAMGEQSDGVCGGTPVTAATGMEGDVGREGRVLGATAALETGGAVGERRCALCVLPAELWLAVAGFVPLRELLGVPRSPMVGCAKDQPCLAWLVNRALYSVFRPASVLTGGGGAGECALGDVSETFMYRLLCEYESRILVTTVRNGVGRGEGRALSGYSHLYLDWASYVVRGWYSYPKHRGAGILVRAAMHPTRVAVEHMTAIERGSWGETAGAFRVLRGCARDGEEAPCACWANVMGSLELLADADVDTWVSHHRRLVCEAIPLVEELGILRVVDGGKDGPTKVARYTMRHHLYTRRCSGWYGREAEPGWDCGDDWWSGRECQEWMRVVVYRGSGSTMTVCEVRVGSCDTSNDGWDDERLRWWFVDATMKETVFLEAAIGTWVYPQGDVCGYKPEGQSCTWDHTVAEDVAATHRQRDKDVMHHKTSLLGHFKDATWCRKTPLVLHPGVRVRDGECVPPAIEWTEWDEVAYSPRLLCTRQVAKKMVKSTTMATLRRVKDVARGEPWRPYDAGDGREAYSELVAECVMRSAVCAFGRGGSSGVYSGARRVYPSVVSLMEDVDGYVGMLVAHGVQANEVIEFCVGCEWECSVGSAIRESIHCHGAAGGCDDTDDDESEQPEEREMSDGESDHTRKVRKVEELHERCVDDVVMRSLEALSSRDQHEHLTAVWREENAAMARGGCGAVWHGGAAVQGCRGTSGGDAVCQGQGEAARRMGRMERVHDARPGAVTLEALHMLQGYTMPAVGDGCCGRCARVLSVYDFVALLWSVNAHAAAPCGSVARGCADSEGADDHRGRHVEQQRSRSGRMDQNVGGAGDACHHWSDEYRGRETWTVGPVMRAIIGRMSTEVVRPGL